MSDACRRAAVGGDPTSVGVCGVT